MKHIKPIIGCASILIVCCLLFWICNVYGKQSRAFYQDSPGTAANGSIDFAKTSVEEIVMNYIISTTPVAPITDQTADPTVDQTVDLTVDPATDPNAGLVTDPNVGPVVDPNAEPVEPTADQEPVAQ